MNKRKLQLFELSYRNFWCYNDIQTNGYSIVLKWAWKLPRSSCQPIITWWKLQGAWRHPKPEFNSVDANPMDPCLIFSGTKELPMWVMRTRTSCSHSATDSPVIQKQYQSRACGEVPCFLFILVYLFLYHLSTDTLTHCQGLPHFASCLSYLSFSYLIPPHSITFRFFLRDSWLT